MIRSDCGQTKLNPCANVAADSGVLRAAAAVGIVFALTSEKVEERFWRLVYIGKVKI